MVIKNVVRVSSTVFNAKWPAVVAAWLLVLMTAYPVAAAAYTADLSHDAQVDIVDLSLLLNHFGQRAEPGSALIGDINGSGAVDIIDLSLMLSQWTIAPSATTTPSATPAITPTPAPTVPAGPLSNKRGVAGQLIVNGNPARIPAVGASWDYNWSPAKPAGQAAGVEFVPMMWDRGHITDTRLAELKQAAQNGTTKHLLAFNEPDHTDQSNMSVEAALAEWPKLESTGLRLGSPAVADASGPWLPAFMAGAAARGYRVDFIAVHYYQDFTNPGAVASLKSMLTTLHDAYQKPIWITEIGTLDIRAWGLNMASEPNVAKAQSYMQQVTTMLDGLPFVERYAWFQDACSPDTLQSINDCAWSTLFDANGQPTELGSVYSRR